MKRKISCMIIMILVLAVAVQPAAAASKQAKTKTVWVIDKISSALNEEDVQTIKYNSKGLIKSYVSNIDYSGINYKYTYNKKNKLTKVTNELQPGTVLITKYEYSGNKLVRSYESYAPFKKSTALKTTYKWSKKSGKYFVKIKNSNYNRTLTLKKDYSLLKSDSEQGNAVTNKFNKMGRLTSSKYEATNATARYKYTENSKGNITKVLYKGQGADSYSDFKYLHYKKIKVPAATYDLVVKQQRYLMEWTCPLWMLDSME